MKILLMTPPEENPLRTSLPPVIEDDTGIFPPLGLLYIAAYVEKIERVSVQVLHCEAEGIDHQKLHETIQTIAPDVVGIQVMTFSLIDATIAARTIRQKYPDTFIVFGGPHPTIYPTESVQIPEVDAVVPGEGEYTFTALVKALLAKQAPENVPGVLTKQKPHLIEPFRHIQNLDELAMPARHLIDTSKYTSPIAIRNPLTTIMSSRGCPGRCIFCDRPQMGKKFRMRSAENVVTEMQYCREELGIGEFLFYDDTFTINKQRVIDICDILIADNLDAFWDIRARIDTVTPEIIKKLKRAGCHRIHYGVESGSPRIQKRLKKNLNLSKVKEVFRMTRKEGIEVLGYFMIGCPDEDTEDLQATIDLIQTLPMDYAHITVLTPYPGTELYQEALKNGFYDNDYWREFALHPSLDFVPKYWNQYFSEEELFRYVKQAYGKFYGRPSYMVKRLLKLRSIDELIRKARLGFKLLKSVYID